MEGFVEKYVNEDSLKTYRDIKNSIDTAREEGRIVGKLEGKEEGRLEGKVEGRLEGLHEGELKASYAIARNSIEAGLTNDIIAQITKLSDDQIIQIRHSLNK